MNKKALTVLINIDGGARGNPGPAGAGVVIKTADDGTVIFEGGFFLGKATNNVAEYHGLLEALAAADKLQADVVEVFSDSELLVRQMNGLYKVKSPNMKPLWRKAKDLASKLESCKFVHVGRDSNSEADELANEALDQAL